jgi:hypothetical protein
VYSFGQLSTQVPAVAVDPVTGIQTLTGAPNVLSENFCAYSTSAGCDVLPQTFFNLPGPPAYSSVQTVTYDDNGSLYTDNASASINSLGFDSGILHGWAQASAGNLDPNTMGLSGSNVDVYLAWIDTEFVEVEDPLLPAGTPVTLQITDHHSGFTNSAGNGDTTIAWVDVIGDGISGLTFENELDTVDPGVTVSKSFDGTPVQFLNTAVGRTLTLDEQLVIQIAGTQYSGNANSVNTSYMNIQDLTPGTELVSASGINYSTVGEGTSVPVPEPPMLTLFALGFTAFGFARWRRHKIEKTWDQNQPRPKTCRSARLTPSH